MNLRHVVSVGLGSSTRDAHLETELLGQPILIERRGTDGNVKAAAKLLESLDGKVDAFGLGGIVLFVQAGGRKYYLRDALKLASHAKTTPVVCGAGLKNTLERSVVEDLDKGLDWQSKKVLMVSGIENFGMAETLDALGADVTYIDAPMILGVPLPLKSLKAVSRAASMLAPLGSQLPIHMIYPTGKNQDSQRETWRSRYFRDADVITGDFHYILRHAPQDLRGKIILTNTTTPNNVAEMKRRGVKTLITTTPRLEGRSLSTNMLEAAFIAVSGKYPLSDENYRELIAASGVKPSVLELN